MKDSVIIFDVDCLLCNRFVQIVSVIDKKDSNVNTFLVDVDSIIFYLNGNIYIKWDIKFIMNPKKHEGHFL